MKVEIGKLYRNASGNHFLVLNKFQDLAGDAYRAIHVESYLTAKKKPLINPYRKFEPEEQGIVIEDNPDAIKKIENILTMIKKEEKMSENVAVADEISVEDFFELTQADQEEAESIYGLDSTDRRQIENVVNQFIEENEFNIDDAAERKAAGEHFMDEYNDNEKEWDGVVDRDKIENAMRYAVAYIAYTNDLNEEQTYEMQHIKLFENFECDEAEVTTEEAKNALGRLYSGIKEGDDFANLFKDGSNAKPVNENGDKDRYARTVKDLDDVRPRMAPAPKPAGMMASEGTKYFDLYLQDQASYIMCDKYGYEKGILNWEYVLGKSSGAMFAASAEIVNQKLQMLRDLGILQEYGKDYFKRSYFDLWKEWKSANSGKLKAAA